jgi:hypothetical protein
MSYAVEPLAAAAPASRRPATVGLAAALLATMGLLGLGYAVATLAVTPRVVDQFRAGAAGADSGDVDGFVTALWVAAAIAMVLAVILFALYVGLALGLRRGSNAARIAVWVVCGLGLLAGCGSAVAVAIQRGADGSAGTIGTALADAYPGGWIGLNVALAVAQIVGYAVVALLLVVSPGTFFGRAPAQPPPDPFAAPRYARGFPTPVPGYGQHPAAYGPPPGFDPSAYAPPPGYAPPQGPVTPSQGAGTPSQGAGTPSQGASTPPQSPGTAEAAQTTEPIDPAQPVAGPGYASSPNLAAKPPAKPEPGSDDDYWSRPPG